MVGEERQVSGEGGDVHDGCGARHLGRWLQEGELGHLAVGRAARFVAAATALWLLALLFVLLLVILLGAKSHHLPADGQTGV